MKNVLKNKYLLVIVFLVAVFIVGYRYSARRIELFGHYEKVWAHRVNDLKKLKSAENSFNGIELDLEFNEKEEKFWVSHGGLTSSPILFSDYLDHLTNKKLGLWLDMKNLKKNNSKKIFNKLEALIASKKIGEKRASILIESTEHSSLKPFYKEGYRTSWYITDTITQINKDEVIQLISEKLTNKKMEISSDYRNYSFLSQAFPNRTKNFWILNSTYDIETIKNYSLIREMLADTSVKTVLIPYLNFNQYF